MDIQDLSPELREKAKRCKTPEELLDLAKEEGYKLSDEEIETISGGNWFTDPCSTANCTLKNCDSYGY